MSQMPPPGPPVPSQPDPQLQVPTQPQQPQQPPAQAPMGWIKLTIQGSVMTSNMITPTVRINGYPVQASYGENVIPVYAGPTHVDLSAQWLRTYGQAALQADVPAGQTVEMFYAAPLHQFARGAIGFEKQKRPGKVLFAVIVTFVLLIAAFLIAAQIFGG